MLSKPEYLIDSNILVYSLNQSHMHHKKALELMKSIQRGEIGGILAFQNILEAFRVLTHRKYVNPMTFDEAFEMLDGYSRMCHIISPNLLTHKHLTCLCNKYRPIGDSIFDTFLVSTMLANDVFSIATNNTKDFEKYAELKKVFNPLI